MIAPSRSIDEMDAEAGSPNRRTPQQQGMTITTAHASPALPAVMKEKTRTALHRFFYPHQHKEYLGTQSTRGVVKSHRTPGRGETEEGDPTTEENGNPLEPPPPEPPSTPREGEHSHGSEILHTPTDRHAPPDMNDPDVKFVTNFWTTFDDILILSIFTQLGIVFRIAIAIWFTWFDGVFSNDSALFVNLPLNCLSCFLMGVLCSGERLMEIITTRFSPPRTQQEMVQHGGVDELRYEYNDDEDDAQDMEHNGGDGIVRSGRQLSVPTRRPWGGGGILRRRRRQKKEQPSMPPERFISWQPPVHLDEELRDVQLLALERRIRMSKCLVLFPVRKQDVDVMEHYFQQGYKRNGRHGSFNEEEEEDAADHRPPRPRRLNDRWNDLDLREEEEESNRPTSTSVATAKARNGLAESSVTIPPATRDAASRSPPPSAAAAVDPLTGSLEVPPATKSDTSSVDEDGRPSTDTAVEENATDYITDFANNIQDNVQENLYRLGRVNLADGWDSGTTAEAMSDDLMLGLRDGFCGALSSFSSWNSAMVSLLRHGNVGQAVVGYIIGLQLPIVAYRFGQHVAVYIFVWRTRREARKDERRGGYGIRLSTNDDLEQYENSDSDDEDDEEKKRKAAEDEMPSLRAVITAIFIMALVTQITSIFFFDTPENQQIALSLLFSPLGVFARWRLAKLNRWKPTFPIGTFSCNILSCALSGSLGTLLSGNIGENQEIVLSSIVNGFGGTLSSLASFVVEILAGVDPILLRYDGVIYAAASIGCAMVVGFIFSASVEWADVVTRTATVTVTEVPSAAPTIFNATDNLTRYW